jgi:heptosyltransferase-2
MNILIIRNDRFGEFLLNIPAFRALKQSYPDAKLTLAVGSSVKDLAECIEYADQVVVWDDNFKRILRKQRFDVCIISNPTKEAHWAVFWAGIPIRVGYDRKWGILLTHKMEDNKSLGLKHEVEYNLDLVSLIAAKTNDKSLSLGKLPAYSNPEYAGAVAIHPYTSDALKQWGLKRFWELAKRISDEFGLRVIIVGKEEGLGGKEFENLGKNVVSLVNKTSLVELAQILKQCKLLVSCDSGPVHLAAAVGTPVIALFRNDLPGKTARRWGPWGEGHTVIEKSSLNDISVDEVAELVREQYSLLFYFKLGLKNGGQ